MRNLLGGKGANLAEMNLIGVPVPPGFTITTEVCTEYYEMGQDKVVALLKNEVEQAIAHVETLMRYIRIFSDLSNQIRFASQKRVLVEIALIKLCRPAMETNLDSVLDRLRVLEKQMEERPVQQVIVRESEAGGAGEPGAAVTGTATVQQQKPQKAAPEDLQKIVAGWRVIDRTDDRDVQADASENLFRSITVRQENLFFMWNFRIFWGSPMWTIRKRRKSFRTLSLLRQEKQ